MWVFKALTQLALAYLPGGERINHQLQRIRQRRGGRNRKTRRRAPRIAASLGRIDAHVGLRDAMVVEVGTGWSAVPSLLLSLTGARVVTFDHVRHVRLSLVREALDVFLSQRSELAEAMGRSVDELEERIRALQACATLDDLFAAARITYRAPADAMRTGFPEDSVDLFYSHSVLEHVPRAVVTGLVREAQRVLTRDGMFYALIGLHDHYAPFGVSRVNFLRYSDRFWRLVAQNRISYMNRMRAPEYIAELERAGAAVIDTRHLLTPGDLEDARRMRVAPRFRGFSAEELAITELEVLAA